MPSVKEKCVCQICICGKHHCGEEIKFPSLLEEPEKERREEVSESRVVVPVDDSGDHLSQRARNEKGSLVETNCGVIACDTPNGHHLLGADQSRPDEQRIVTITVKRSKRKEAPQKTKDDSTTDRGGPETWAEMKAAAGENEKEGLSDEARTRAEEGGSDSEMMTIKTSQRKTWQTNPEQVEELTRSLSRLRTDHDNGGYLYEKMVEKEKSKTLNRRAQEKTLPRKEKDGKGQQQQSSTYHDQPHLVNGNKQQQQQQQHFCTAKMNGKGERKDAASQQQKESFLPPLTGFSDSDSSFGSFSCSVEGDHHLVGDKAMHCICESVKKSKLEEQESHQEGANIQFIDVDDNWIVTRPARAKPRDNLRLEGPMEMETTFRSTYETTAQRMIDRDDSEEDSAKSKRSTATTSRTGGKNSAQLYLNRSRGRTGATLLRSAKKRRNIRNRPMTSLKAGGDGSYSTNSRDAYKNFIIVDGEAKMVGETLKLPKVVTKTTLTTSEKKNRHKYVKSKSACKKTADCQTAEKGAQKTVMIGGEEICKFEKKSYIAKGDGAEEITDVEQKFVRKMKRPPKEESAEQHKEDGESPTWGQVEEEKSHWEEGRQPASYTVDNISGAPKRPFRTRHQDNIREMGLLDRSEESAPGKVDNYRQHMRRLHETSKDFNLLCLESPLPDDTNVGRSRVRPQAESKEADQQQTVAPKVKVVNGHAVMSTSRKPFIIPQRIQRHKNECSVNVFEGDMDFTTTNRTYGGSNGGTRKAQRIGSGNGERKRTAGRRYLRSGKRRNLFRQSSDSMFASPGEQPRETSESPSVLPPKATNTVTSTSEQPGTKCRSTYKKVYDDRLYCPALDVPKVNGNDNFKYTGEAGGHKYYLSTNYT